MEQEFSVQTMAESTESKASLEQLKRLVNHAFKKVMVQGETLPTLPSSKQDVIANMIDDLYNIEPLLSANDRLQLHELMRLYVSLAMGRTEDEFATEDPKKYIGDYD